MEALLVSAAVVAVAEIGDKTQLLSLILAAKYRKPLPIIGGILVATLANHLGAAFVGSLVANLLSEQVMAWILGLGFVAMAVWALIPDKEEEPTEKAGRFGPFVATTIAFFLLEMGDKTQIATVALGARFQGMLLWVTAGTTIGMMAANVPAVLLGDVAAKKLPLGVVRTVAAVIFLVLGVLSIGHAIGWV